MKIIPIMLLAVLILSTATAADHALLLFGKAGDETMLRRYRNFEETLRTTLPQLGFPPETITVWNETNGFNAAAVKQTLDRLAQRQQPEDRCWVFLFGHTQPGRNSLFLKLPRGVFPVGEFVKALNAIAGEQLIFCLTPYSYELQEALRGDTRTVIACAAQPGASNPPEVSEQLLRRLNDPGDGWLTLFRESALATSAEAKRRSIYNNDTIRLTQGTLSALPPFADVNESQLPRRRSQAELPRQAVDSSPAASATTHAEEPFTCVEREIERVYNSSGNLEEIESRTLLIQNSDGAEALTLCFFPLPPGGTFEVLAAQHRLPDGGTGRADAFPAAQTLRFPGLKPGSVIAWRIRIRHAEQPNQAPGGELPLALPCSQQKLTLKLSYPKNLPLHVQFRQLPQSPKPEQQDGIYNRELRVVLHDLPAWEPPDFLPTNEEFDPRLRISLWSGWQEFLDWFNPLLAGTEATTADTVRFAEELTDGAEDPTARLRLLYDALNALRYDTTPLGVRALRPRLTDEVLSTGYGDCKDKANALVVLARAIGIEGKLALLNRNGNTDTTFPMWQFNHAIAYFPSLPGYPDGLWLDATDTETPFGTLPPGDLGRQALLLGPKPEFKTVTSANASHQLTRTFTFPAGQPGTYQAQHGGCFLYRYRHRIKRHSAVGKQKSLQQELSTVIPGIGVLSADFRADHESAKLEATNTAPAVLPPAFLQEAFAAPERQFPLALCDGQGFTLIDKITCDAMADSPLVNRQEQAGPLTVTISTTINGTKITQQRTLQFLTGRIESADYSAVRRLFWRSFQP